MEEVTQDKVVSTPAQVDTSYTIEQMEKDYPESFTDYSPNADQYFDNIVPEEEPQTEDLLEEEEVSENELDSNKFILDGVDLSFVPEELRKETLADTLNAYKEFTDNTLSNLEKSKVDLNNYKELLKQEGYTNEFEAFYQTQTQNIEQIENQELNRAYQDLDRLVKEGKMSVHEANVKYGEVKANLAAVKQQELEKAYSNTNLAVVEKLIGEHEEVLNIPVIAQATESFLKDIIQDKRLVSHERSAQYLQLAKGIYDEAFKAGLAASKQAEATKSLEATKNKVRNPQVAQGVSTPPVAQEFPYKSFKDVSDDVWMNDTEIRRHFLYEDINNGLF